MTAKQIMSIFSRLDDRRSLSVHFLAPIISDEDEENGEAVITDTSFGELRAHVMVSVQPNHPIGYEIYNPCHRCPSPSSHFCYYHAEGYLRALRHRHRGPHR